MNRAAIILVNWNGWSNTLECLESLQKLEYPDFRVIVCDNGSTDDSLQQIRRWAKERGTDCRGYNRETAERGGDKTADPFLTLISINANLGFAGGNNVALRFGLARGFFDYFWLLNNDTVVNPDALNHLASRMEEEDGIGICGSTILLYHDRTRVQALGGARYAHWLGLPWHHGRFSGWKGKSDRRRAESWMNYVEGASMLVSRQFVEQVGLMSEEYFLYFEEVDWAIRGRRHHYRLGYAPESIVYHKVGASIGTSSNPARKSAICDYYNIRNRILFTHKYYPAALPMVYLVLAGEVLVRLLCGVPDRAVMIIRLMLTGADLENRP